MFILLSGSCICRVSLVPSTTNLQLTFRLALCQRRRKTPPLAGHCQGIDHWFRSAQSDVRLRSQIGMETWCRYRGRRNCRFGFRFAINVTQTSAPGVPFNFPDRVGPANFNSFPETVPASSAQLVLPGRQGATARASFVRRALRTLGGPM